MCVTCIRHIIYINNTPDIYLCYMRKLESVIETRKQIKRVKKLSADASNIRKMLNTDK